MATAALTTLGCKVNQYETQKILESLEEAGFRIVPFDSPADLYVINSCSVTSDAERKSRYTIRKAKNKNPQSKVVVTGCAAQMGLNRSEPIEGADLIVPNPQKLETKQWILRQFEEFQSLEPVGNSTATFSGRTRATLKVQDGCSVMCSYCSIPYTRPGMVSRPYEQVLEEAQKLAELGFKEIILTGVLIGAYGPETGSKGPCFEELVQLLAEQSGVPRIRISSIEVHQVTQPLIDLVKAGWVVPHFHIPLQSGDSHVLKDMNRRYDQRIYLDLCEKLYSEIPDLSLTTDIMVGFPTETAERFRSSIEVCEQARYHSAHIFTFSPRWGTPADQWGDPVSPQEKAERRLELMRTTQRTGSQHARRFLGRTMRVLVESKPTKEGLLQGLTDNYLTVQFAGSQDLIRQLVWVRLDENRDGTLYGEVTSSAPMSSPLRVLS